VRTLFYKGKTQNRYARLIIVTCYVSYLFQSLLCYSGQEEQLLSNYQTKPFSKLSEQVVSRQGQLALNMSSVTWEHGESDSFIFHFEKGFLCPQFAAASESFYKLIKQHLEITEDSYQRKSHVYVFLGENSWNEFVSGANLDQWTGGWCTGRELFIRSRPNPRFQNSTLPHEITHLVLYRFIGEDMPIWLNEGLAEFEGRRLQVLYLKKHNYRAGGHSSRVSIDQYIPLKELTSFIDYPDPKAKVEAFYNESERLIHFLYHKHNGMKNLIEFIELQSKGLTFQSALESVYKIPSSHFSEFEQTFIEYATKEVMSK